MRDVPAPEWIDASWWEVTGARSRAEEMSREYWVGQLARRWQLVRRADALSAEELRAQEQRAAFLLSGGFLPTNRLTGFVVHHRWSADVYPLADWIPELE